MRSNKGYSLPSFFASSTRLIWEGVSAFMPAALMQRHKDARKDASLAGMISKPSLALTAFYLMVSTSTSLAFDLQELAAPPETNLGWVGQDMVQNGLPMQVVQVQSRLAMTELLRFYRQDWRSYHKPGTRATVESNVGEWRMLSTLVEQHNVVLQLKAEGGQTSGFLSAVPLDAQPQKNAITNHFPRQGNTQLVSSTESNDGGVKATTLVLRNDLSLQANQSFYQNTLRRNGWTLARSRVEGGVAAMLFDRSSGSLELAIHRDKDTTTIFANVKGEDI